MPILKPGDILAGKYRVDRVLGQGGMGLVLAATHVDLHEPRAIKVMLSTAMPDAEAVERFAREARAASLLKSEHVARVYDVGRLDDGAPFMVMEYLEGRDLSSLIKTTGAQPAHEAVLYVLQASEALAEAHARGIVHRDLKPANLFLTYRTDGSPCVKVLDFGISKVVGAPGDYDMTSTHAILGSPHYMSPEQMHSTRTVDGRADIWSLGVILYQLVCGRLPFRGASITEIVAQVLESAPPPPSQVSLGNPHLDVVIMRCLQREPSRRFANVAELAQALLPFAPEGSGPLVDRIARVSNALVRTATGMPAVRVDGQRFGGDAMGPSGPRAASNSGTAWGPATPLSSPRPESGAMPTPVRFVDPQGPAPIAGSGTGGWGGTGPLVHPPRRTRALIAVTFGIAVTLGALIAWTLTKGSVPQPSPTAASPATASPTTAPSITATPITAPPSASVDAPATASVDAPATPTVNTSASASSMPIGAKPLKPSKPLKDPFGMDRK